MIVHNRRLGLAEAYIEVTTKGSAVSNITTSGDGMDVNTTGFLLHQPLGLTRPLKSVRVETQILDIFKSRTIRSIFAVRNLECA
jgi:hypothetical protein